MKRKYQLGDLVVFTRTKHSLRPGPRARHVVPAQAGDDYTYQVDKYWMVKNVLSDGQLVLMTRRGKLHTIPPDHPNLRHARFWERLRFRDRFPQVDTIAQNISQAASA